MFGDLWGAGIEPAYANRRPVFILSKGSVILVSSLLLVTGAYGQDIGTLIERGQPLLNQVHTEPSLGNTHVPAGTPVAEDQPFPLSGPHWPAPTASGFYQETQPKGALIHALEHGQVVVYYDKPGFKAISILKKWSKDQANYWSGIVAVPHEGLGTGLVLTAWQHRLELPEFDEAALAAFVDAYSGRGPENPIR